MRDPLWTDEEIERAAEGADNVRFRVDWKPMWDGMPDSYKEMRCQQMRAALDAVPAVPLREYEALDMAFRQVERFVGAGPFEWIKNDALARAREIIEALGDTDGS